MTTFNYSAINAQGVELKGELHAPISRRRATCSASAACSRSASTRPARSSWRTSGMFKKVDPKALQIFSRQFATLIEAGVSVVSSLSILQDQTVDKNLAAMIDSVRTDVESGMILSKALSQHPAVFNRLYVSMVEAGEASGTLDRVLDRLAVQIEKTMQIKRRVKRSDDLPDRRPLLRVARADRDAALPRPGVREDLLAAQRPAADADPDRRQRLERAALVLLHHLPADRERSIFGLRRWKRTEKGRRIWDTLKLRIPMQIGDVVLKVTMARFSRTLATLVGSGVDIVKALEITGNTSGNWVVEQALAEVRVKVHEGVPIAQPLIENPVFPPMVSQMIKIGEETGRAREDAREDRRLLRGRGRDLDQRRSPRSSSR